MTSSSEVTHADLWDTLSLDAPRPSSRSQNSEQTYGHAVPYQMLRERFRPCSKTPSQLLWASDPYFCSMDYTDWLGEQKGHWNGHRAQSSGLLTVIHSLQKHCLDSQREGGRDNLEQTAEKGKESMDRRTDRWVTGRATKCTALTCLQSFIYYGNTVQTVLCRIQVVLYF